MNIKFQRVQTITINIADGSVPRRNGKPWDRSGIDEPTLEWWANNGYMGASMLDHMIESERETAINGKWELADKPQAVPECSRKHTDDLRDALSVDDIGNRS